MQQSPFYSYIQDVPLIAFGAVNLLFGIVTFFSLLIFLIRTSRLRMLPGPGFIKILMASKTTVFTITGNAIGVLAIAVVNFVFFVIDKAGFNNWCIRASADYFEETYNSTLIDQSNNITTGGQANITANPLDRTMDIYNCERLYKDEIKWSLLALIIMFIVYIHWILIIAAKQSYNFYRRPPMLNSLNEFGNIAPSAYRKYRLENNNSFENIKPSKKRSLLRDLLVHKQYNEFCFGNTEIDVTVLDDDESKNTMEEKKPTTKFIQFEDHTNNTFKPEELKRPGNAFIS
ncbi:MAG: hypothetical protein EXX96DRAFT_579703 [Benjaminiella poitrasii]|nr:MAG: hypothetical protein EXX96DRAFT_579703 [Benjaminiella poitrasii]